MWGALSARWMLAAALISLVAAARPPQVRLDPPAKARARELVFTEGGQPIQLAPSGLSVSASPGRLLRSAKVYVVNPMDTNLEEIITAGASSAGVAQSFDPVNASLTLHVVSPQPSSSVLLDALSSLAYVHKGIKPDRATRVVSMSVKDDIGAESLPVPFLITISDFNNPPILDLNGPRDGINSHVYMDEAERSGSVKVFSKDLFAADEDSDLLQSATVAIQNPRDFEDGQGPPVTIESLTADAAGTSINVTHANGTIHLSGQDVISNYVRVLSSVRYMNKGVIIDARPGSNPARFAKSTKLQFTPGVRNISVEIVDDRGARAVAFALVEVLQTNRTGPPGVDPTIESIEFCSGQGYRLVVEGEASCICEDGYEGDECEIVPCLGQGQYVPGGDCLCYYGYTGQNCSVVCGNHGDLVDGLCQCHPGYAGVGCTLTCDDCDPSNGVCRVKPEFKPDKDGNYQKSVETFCDCHPFHMGKNCAAECPCNVNSHGNCTLVESAVTATLSAECTCEDGWTGDACDKKCPECDGKNGVCMVDRDEAGVEAEAATCKCDAEGVNSASGIGWSGPDCSIPCQPCDMGVCSSVSGACLCFVGWAGPRCDQECMGHGAIVWPELNDTFTVADLDVLPAIPGSNTTESSGVFNTSALYGAFGPNNETIGHCLCNYGRDANFDLVEQKKGNGFSGPYCEIECPPCSEFGTCVYDGVSAECVCDKEIDNGLANGDIVAAFLGKDLVTGKGYTGPECDIPCLPCFNGTCASYPGTAGECVCEPGFSGESCLTECGCDQSPLFECDYASESVWKHGVLDPHGAAEGGGLVGLNPVTGEQDVTSSATCTCEYMWSGDMCQYPCPFIFDRDHGQCVMKDEGDVDFGEPWKTEIVCNEGWTGVSPGLEAEAAESPSIFRNCSVPCDPCEHGSCQATGECLCDYGYIWQGPLSPESETGFYAGIVPYPALVPVVPGLPYERDPTLHNCSVPHPCNMNGEYLNATCGFYGNGTVSHGLEWTVIDEATNTGVGCSGTLVDSRTCVNGTFILGMTYTSMEVTFLSDMPANTELGVTESSKRRFANHGEIHGGVCEEPLLANGLNIGGGVCLCDNIQNGRFKHPSSSFRKSGGYDYFWQGWAGEQCEIPCSPCSQNGYCNLTTGECVCHPGWNGYRCLTPCEKCEHGTCQYDGTCKCDGDRRLIDDTYALRLTRDPLYAEKGVHRYDQFGQEKEEYIHPAYMSAASVEDFLWEVEYECGHRLACRGRTPDTHVTVRPMETYFRFSTPNTTTRDHLGLEIVKLGSQIDAMKSDIEHVPFSLNNTMVGFPAGFISTALEDSVFCDRHCLEEMQMKRWGRTFTSCGGVWGDSDQPGDGIRPWDCDNVVKAHYVREANLEIGRMRMRQLNLIEQFEQEERWLSLNLNERQNLLDRYVRGLFNSTTGEWEEYRHPDFYSIWVLHQLLYGVVQKNGYSGWDCSIPCNACDPDHGTCQFDGTCECEQGWYGDACDRRCDCFTYSCGTSEEVCDFSDALTSTEQGGHSLVTDGGFLLKARGRCRRDGSCACETDEFGVQWTGRDCFTRCAPCSHGVCQMDGSCQCEEGWSGADCAVRTFTECLPCDFEHGVCLTDGTCKCDRGWTGLDCSLQCSQCDHGDCQMDGTCRCRPGWTLPDCSKHTGSLLVASDFLSGPDGWTMLNNTCLGDLQSVGGAPGARGTGLKAKIGYCGTAAGKQNGLFWDEKQRKLLATDLLPQDRLLEGEVHYFRAPQKFLGDKLHTYGQDLVYSLHVADSLHMANNLGQARDITSRDIILVGGVPWYNLTLPDLLHSGEKEEIYNWSRETFPELKLNVRWSKQRLLHTVKSYMRTPQVYLGFDVLQYLSQVLNATRAAQETFARCMGDECAMNLNVRLDELSSWVNLPTIPAGFGWTGRNARRESADRFVNVREDTEYTGFRVGLGQPEWEWNSFTEGGYGSDAGAPAWDYESGPKNWKRDQEGYNDGRFLDDLYLSAVGRDDILRGNLGDPRRRSPRAAGYGGLGAAPFRTSRDEYSYERIHWDMLPEVYDAIKLNRGNYWGRPAKFTDMAHCLASLNELLIRGDFFSTENSRKSAWGPGETVRLDYVALAQRDPHEGEPEVWQRREYDAFMQYLAHYTDERNIHFLDEYFKEYQEAIRLSICSGNGVRANSTMPCECSAGFVGEECGGVCPACARGQCVPAAGGAAECDCPEGWGGPLCNLACPPCEAGQGECNQGSWKPGETAEAGPYAVCNCSEGWTGQLCEARCPESCGSGTCSHAQVGLRWVNGTAAEVPAAVDELAAGAPPATGVPLAPGAEGGHNQTLDEGEGDGGAAAAAAAAAEAAAVAGRRLAEEEGTEEGPGGRGAEEEAGASGTGGGAAPGAAGGGGGAFCVCFAGASGDFCDQVEVVGADAGEGGADAEGGGEGAGVPAAEGPGAPTAEVPAAPAAPAGGDPA